MDQPPPPGTLLTARIRTDSPKTSGFLLPRSAVLQHQSSLFVYVQSSDKSFERKAVESGAPMEQGVFVVKGIKAEDAIVTTGAQQLLSEELKRNHPVD